MIPIPAILNLKGEPDPQERAWQLSFPFPSISGGCRVDRSPLTCFPPLPVFHCYRFSTVTGVSIRIFFEPASVVVTPFHHDDHPVSANPVQAISMIGPRANAESDRQMMRSFLEIAKPRISTMVLFTVWAGSVASGWAGANFAWVHAMIGTLLVAASGSAMNQYLERYSDFFMPRTTKRPLPAGRLSASEVVIFAAVTFGSGMGYLLATVHWSAAAWCFATWVLYSFVYTLLKPVTAWNTLIGAFPGAMPVLVGAAAYDGNIQPLSWLLFAILLLWQFPHFMAIAWKYRSDYAEAKLQMVTVTDPSGRQAGLIAVVTAAVLLLVSLIAVVWLASPVLYAGISLGLGGMYLWRSLQFYTDTNNFSARKLLLFSLLYLPLQMVALLVCNAWGLF